MARPASKQPTEVELQILRILWELGPSPVRDIHKRLESFTPTPGMPADIYIKTGERTFFEYIMKPVLDSFSRAFREN